MLTAGYTALILIPKSTCNAMLVMLSDTKFRTYTSSLLARQKKNLFRRNWEIECRQG